MKTKKILLATIFTSLSLVQFAQNYCIDFENLATNQYIGAPTHSDGDLILSENNINFYFYSCDWYPWPGYNDTTIAVYDVTISTGEMSGNGLNFHDAYALIDLSLLPYSYKRVEYFANIFYSADINVNSGTIISGTNGYTNGVYHTFSDRIKSPSL